MQLLAVEGIGKFVAAIFADPARFSGETFEIASDTVTGRELGALFSEAAGQTIAYARFPDDVLATNAFLGKLTALLDEGPLAGHADLDALREINPAMLSFRGHGCREAGARPSTKLLGNLVRGPTTAHDGQLVADIRSSSVPRSKRA